MLALMFATIGCSAEMPKSTGQPGQAIPRIAVMTLVDTPEIYDGKTVIVQGFLSYGLEERLLCDRDRKNGSPAQCIWLSVDDDGPYETGSDFKLYLTKEAKLLKFEGQVIFVKGVFDMKNKGHLGGMFRVGGLRKLVEVSASNPHSIFRESEFANQAGQVNLDSRISVLELIANPERYNGKTVLVNGYVLRNFPGAERQEAICQSEVLTTYQDCIRLIVKRDSVDADDHNTIHISEEYWEIKENFWGRRAFIRGTFDTHNKGEFEEYVGSIKDIIEIFGEYTPVFFESAGDQVLKKH
jgi:hypothetical protein